MPVQQPRVQAYLVGAWTDLPMMATPIQVRRGVAPFGSWPRPTQITCEIDNDSLDYDPARPASLLYGIAGRNTRIRVLPDSNLVRVWGEATSWEPDRTPDHVPGAQRGRSATALSAEGLLRRIGAWTDPLRSPMYRTISARATCVGHWALEDDSAALLAASSIPGGRPARIKGDVTLADDDAPDGAAQSARMTNGSAIAGEFLSSSLSGWQVAFSFKLPSMPASAVYGTLLAWTTSNGYTWRWQVNDTTYRLHIEDAEAAVLYSAAVGFGSKEPTRWITMRIKTSVSGSTVTVEPAWYEQGDTVVVGFTDTFSGSAGRLTSATVTGNSWNDGGWFSHLFGVAGTADDLLSGEALASFNGYRGERSGSRYNRIMSEVGLTRYVIGTSSLTVPMGPQRPDTLLGLLREIRETEAGRIDDERLDIALTGFWRNALYNQTPALQLQYPGDISPPFRGRLSDDGVANRVTVKNRDGGEHTAERLTGPMSVAPPPEGVGEYRAQVDVNVSDERWLADRANWELARGTLGRPVYDAVTVDVVANPGLLSACRGVREGNLITVAGYEPDLIRLLVVGIVERTTSGTHTFTFEVEPYDVFHVGIWDDPSWRWDSRTSTMAAGVSSSATSITVEFTDRQDFWSTSAGYDIVVGGERMTVSVMGAVSGSGPWSQTATVVRAVNGVSKAQTAGTEVHVYQARRWAL